MYMSVREFLKTFHIDCIFVEKTYSTWFIFCLVQLQVLPPGKALRFLLQSLFPLFQILHRSRRYCYRHFQSLSVLYFCCYFPAEQLLFPILFYLLFIRLLLKKSPELSSNPENEFLTLLSDKNKEKQRNFWKKLFQAL